MSFEVSIRRLNMGYVVDTWSSKQGGIYVLDIAELEDVIRQLEADYNKRKKKKE